MTTEPVVDQGEDPGLGPEIVGGVDNGGTAPTAPTTPGPVARAARAVAALGMLAPAACSAPAPTAHRSAPTSAPADTGSDATAAPTAATSTEPVDVSAPGGTSLPSGAGPTTTITVTVPATVARSTTTTIEPFTLPEAAEESYTDVEWLIRQTFPESPDRAVRIAKCESGLNPRAVSPTNDYGLMQINIVHRARAARMGYSWDQMLQVMPNLAVARAVYDDAGGWGPWTCR